MKKREKESGKNFDHQRILVKKQKIYQNRQTTREKM